MLGKVCVKVGHGAQHGAQHGAKPKNIKILDFFKFFKYAIFSIFSPFFHQKWGVLVGFECGKKSLFYQILVNEMGLK